MCVIYSACKGDEVFVKYRSSK